MRDELRNYMQKQILKYKSKLSSNPLGKRRHRSDSSCSSRSESLSSPNSRKLSNKRNDLTLDFIKENQNSSYTLKKYAYGKKVSLINEHKPYT